MLAPEEATFRTLAYPKGPVYCPRVISPYSNVTNDIFIQESVCATDLRYDMWFVHGNRRAAVGRFYFYTDYSFILIFIDEISDT